jgi:flagellar assembly protein FliH
MARNVFKAGELTQSGNKVHISPPIVKIKKSVAVEQLTDLAPLDEYSGPTVDDLRKEAENFKQEWEKERQQMIDLANEEAKKIVSDAENLAFEEIRKKNEQAQEIKSTAEAEAEKVIQEAQKKADELIQDAMKKSTGIEDDAREEGMAKGQERGYEDGKAEMERVIDRLHLIINKAIDRRNEIIEESEAQLVQLVLQIARKVIKVISENQKNVVINNVVQALRKLKNKADVVIRVNLDDLQTTTAHTKEIINRIERVNTITVLEDSSVDPGGCIIEADFGQIDARITSQLREIEERIIELAPIKAQRKVTGTLLD